jgi:hypothetical protein
MISLSALLSGFTLTSEFETEEAYLAEKYVVVLSTVSTCNLAMVAGSPKVDNSLAVSPVKSVLVELLVKQPPDHTVMAKSTIPKMTVFDDFTINQPTIF